MAKNRYVGEYPAIGIRPIIDGRRGPMQLLSLIHIEMCIRDSCSAAAMLGKPCHSPSTVIDTAGRCAGGCLLYTSARRLCGSG